MPPPPLFIDSRAFWVGFIFKTFNAKRKGYAEFAKENLGLMSKIKVTEDFVGMVELPANSVPPPTLTH